ncbi:MAG: precorrin-4 C(11)-methyltransferase [Isosphaeraceae bacterium]
MTDTPQIALIAVTSRGVELARRLRARLRSGHLYRADRHGPASPGGWEFPMLEPLAERVPDLFARYDQLVFFLAAGAVTRLIAPCLVSKLSDPGVVVVDEAGQFVVPILSGHEGGANEMARRVAGALGATPVVTTASDVGGGLNLSELEAHFGWIPEPRDRLKPTAIALLDQAPVAIIQEIGAGRQWLDEGERPGWVAFATSVDGLPRRDYERIVWITDRLVDNLGGFDEGRILWFRPRSLVLGVGCERGISVDALEDGVDRTLAAHGFSPASVRVLATADLKSDEEAILELADRRGWETTFYPVDELARVPGILNPSRVVQECVGTPGVSEPAALLAAGAEGLLVEKQVVASALSPRRMTLALARSDEYRPRPSAVGRVVFIGAGPGDPELLTLKARRIIKQAEVVVYAGSLIPEAIVREAPPDAILHDSAHLTLEEIAEVLVSAARAGKRVARLQSGDPSLYSAIQEQIEVLVEAGIAVEVVPGISAYQAAAAALKAELTLPEVVQTVILTRGEGRTSMPEAESLASLATHRATLCLFLSARIGEKVQAQLLTSYPPETPTAILYRISQPDEKIILTELAHLAEELRKNQLTRTTLIMVGEAIGGRRNRSRLYDRHHAHLFRRAVRETQDPAP